MILSNHLKFHSISEIKNQGKSLGIIKPQTINKYYHQEDEREWKPQQQSVQDQLDLFESAVELEKIPYKFYYDFVAEDGTRHKLSIIDWEIQQLYRNCRDNSHQNTLEKREQEALKKVKQKLSDDFMSKKDLYFIVGNQQKRPHGFMIIGLFYPPKIEFEQLSLF